VIPTHDALIALYLYRGESIAQLAQLAELAFFEMETGSDGQLATWAHWTARANWNGGRSWMAGPAIVVFPTAPRRRLHGRSATVYHSLEPVDGRRTGICRKGRSALRH
jgi:hypothetical protein